MHIMLGRREMRRPQRTGNNLRPTQRVQHLTSARCSARTPSRSPFSDSARARALKLLVYEAVRLPVGVHCECVCVRERDSARSVCV